MLPRGEAERLLASERVRRSGWLLKAYGDGPQLTWRRKWVRLHPPVTSHHEVWRALFVAARGAGWLRRGYNIGAQLTWRSWSGQACTAGCHVAQAAMMRKTLCGQYF